jgi:hypothetical protein
VDVSFYDQTWIGKYDGTLQLLVSTITPSSFGIRGDALAFSPSGDVIVVGHVAGGSLVAVKFSSELVMLSSRTFAGPPYLIPEDLVVSLDGTIRMAGRACDAQSCFGGVGDLFVGRIDSGFSSISMTRYNGSANRDDGGNGLFVTDNNEILVAGTVDVSTAPGGSYCMWTGHYDANLVLTSSATLNPCSMVSNAGSRGYSILQLGANSFVTIGTITDDNSMDLSRGVLVHYQLGASP